jgi:hypothetical protein
LINQSLDRFVAAWNSHGIRTEDFFLSPNQIEYFARRSGDIFSIPDDVNVFDCGTLLENFDIFDDNNVIPLVQVSDIDHPFNDDDDLDLFMQQVVLITINDMAPGEINIENCKNKWIDAYVLLGQIVLDGEEY